MKIYTKTGDDGYSSLMNAKRIKKSEAVFELLGTIDELSSHIGLVRVSDTKGIFDKFSEDIQKMLSKLMASVASADDKKYEISEKDISFIEEKIDFFEKETDAEFCFVLPGGCELSARLDIARCMARRAERAAVRTNETYPVSKNTVIYLNRLSDLLYIMARYADKVSGGK